MRAAVGFAGVVCLFVLNSCSPSEAPVKPVKNVTSERDLWFSDAAERTGLSFTHANGMSGAHYMTEILGSGVALLDYDNDGDLDVFLVQSQGRSRLFRNNLAETGSLSFTDVTKRSGTDVAGWSVSAVFFDYDRDGWPDLFVGTYLRYSLEHNTPCFSPSGVVDYCTPNTYRPQPSRLFHNNRDGTFTDVTARSGIGSEYGPALGVSAADFNGDGWIDLFVANDSQPNQLWINQHDGTFKNTALAAGVALTAEGKAEASMGVDAADADNDGDDDLFITEQNGEGHNLYVNDGKGGFEDQSARSGLAAASLAFTGFGTAWFDFDNDGWLDLLTVNGAVQTIQALAQAHDPFPLHQTKQLFRNVGHGRFEDVSAKAGRVFELSEVGRGAAFGDIDNDGDTDVVINNNNGPVRLLINNVGNKNHWIGVGARVGARVEIIRKNSPTLWRRARVDGSYASANDPRALVGLGESSDTPIVRVHWPDGRTTDAKDVAIDRYIAVEESSR